MDFFNAGRLIRLYFSKAPGINRSGVCFDILYLLKVLDIFQLILLNLLGISFKDPIHQINER